jgi:hypothetical protein
MTIWRTRIACWILIATKTHSEYIILATFPLQQWLHECASMLRDTYIASPFILSKEPTPILRPTQPHIPRMLGADSLEVNLLGQASNNPRPFQSRAEIKNMCSYTSIPPYVFLSWCFFNNCELYLESGGAYCFKG